MPAATNSVAGSRLLRGPLPVIVLLVCHLALGYSAVCQKSMTFDEGVHLTGGMSYWSLGDYRMHPENGNWSQRLAALPVWLSGTRFVPTGDITWDTGLPWETSDHFLFRAGNDLDTMLVRGRAAIALASAALGLLVYLWSRKLFGLPGGLISLTLYAFSPTFLANGFLTTSDLMATLFFTASVGCLWTLLQCVTLAAVGATCFSVAGLLLVKFSGVLIGPMAAVLVAIRLSDLAPVHWRIGRPREVNGLTPQLALFAGLAVVVALGVSLVIWTSYGFRYSAFAPDQTNEATRFQVTWEGVEEGLPPYVARALELGRQYKLLPEAWMYGFGYTLFTGARHSFLDGMYSTKGWARFFPYCFAWKNPLSLFVVLALGMWGCRVARRAAMADAAASKQRAWWYPLSPLLVLWGVYWATAITSSMNIGHRHILPTYPPLFILAGAAGLWFRSFTGSRAARSKKDPSAANVPGGALITGARVAVLAALASYAIVAVWSWPNYLAYFNLLSGGPDHAYRRLVDSSLDWGQDLKGLKRWLHEHQDDTADGQRVYLSYFGMAGPQYYGIDVRPLPSFRMRWHDEAAPPPLVAGLYCISATMVQPIYGNYPGHWNTVYEELYQRLRSVFEAPVQQGADLSAMAKLVPQLNPEELKMALRNYEELRFSRLCSFLRQREPTTKIGYSILIYRLTDADLAQALVGPPSELLAKPENQP
ncbi:MAG TPA: hypothetical protein VGN12_19855 [Pirellulales bacterium]